MSYLIAEDFTDLRVDFLHQGTATASAGSPFTLVSPASFNTNITTTSNTITLYSGSSYYLEGSPLCSTSTGSSALIRYGFYDIISGTYIGQNAEMTMLPDFSSSARLGRRVCSALVLDSDISTSMIVQLRIIAISSTGWAFSGFPTWAGQPTIRVLQLPS